MAYICNLDEMDYHRLSRTIMDCLQTDGQRQTDFGTCQVAITTENTSFNVNYEKRMYFLHKKFLVLCFVVAFNPIKCKIVFLCSKTFSFISFNSNQN